MSFYMRAILGSGQPDRVIHNCRTFLSAATYGILHIDVITFDLDLPTCLKPAFFSQ